MRSRSGSTVVLMAGLIVVGAITLGLLVKSLVSQPTGPGDTDICPAESAADTATGDAQALDPASTAFAGRGPHQVLVVDRTNGVGLGKTTAWLPTDWLAPPSRHLDGDDSIGVLNDFTADAYNETARRPIQLVACVYLATHNDTPTQTCPYVDVDTGTHASGGTVTIDAATFTVVVREARTGRTVGNFSVPGTPGICASSVRHTSNESFSDTRIEQPNGVALIDGLRPYVENPR